MLTACASNDTSTSTTPPEATSNAAAVNTAETETKQTDATDTTEERLVCRNEKTIGSNKKVRTCRKIVGS